MSTKKNKPVADENLTDTPNETNEDDLTSEEDTSQPPVVDTPVQQQVRYFRNTNITSLSFVTLQGKMYSFTDGVFCSDDPTVIERLQETEDYKHGFIKEFDPSQPTNE